MVDSGAMHNFVSREEAERVGLKSVPQQRTLKTVNSEARPSLGEARGLDGVTNFSVVPLDDFKVILGMVFLRGQNTMMLPKFNTLTLMGADQSHTVHCHSTRSKSQPTLSAMQLKKVCVMRNKHSL
ncbi:hypothetical protein EJ110_NYTH29940 [Nymphaea thermarum]|nr:hypothetical protein EJ110_NYTH29940 [Nymphaea thermarum]